MAVEVLKNELGTVIQPLYEVNPVKNHQQEMGIFLKVHCKRNTKFNHLIFHKKFKKDYNNKENVGVINIKLPVKNVFIVSDRQLIVFESMGQNMN